MFNSFMSYNITYRLPNEYETTPSWQQQYYKDPTTTIVYK